jgi:flagellar biosynthesis component FlhA
MFSSFLIPFCFVGSSCLYRQQTGAEVIIECSAIEQVVFSVSESDNVHANTKTSTVFAGFWVITQKPLIISEIWQVCILVSNTISMSFNRTVTWQVSHMEQELLTLPEHLSSLSVFSGLPVARSLVFCVVFCDNTMAKTKRTKGQTTIYKTLHRKLKIEQQEAHWKPRVN